MSSSFPDDFAVMYEPKIEPESGTDSSDSDDSDIDWPSIPSIPVNKTSSKLIWSHVDTVELIKSLSTECQELWDLKNPLYRDKAAKTAKQEYLARKFNTTSEEIVRKVHNLRTQFNAEVRKIKRHRAKGLNEAETKRWEYFESLMFLQPDALSQCSDDLSENDFMDQSLYTLPGQSTSGETINLELAHFQTEEDLAFGRNQDALPKAEAQTQEPVDPLEDQNRKRKLPKTKEALAVEALAKLVYMKFPIPPSDVRYTPSYVPVAQRDECQVFGDFVATELRNLRSADSRIKLRRMIMSSILKIGRDER